MTTLEALRELANNESCSCYQAGGPCSRCNLAYQEAREAIAAEEARLPLGHAFEAFRGHEELYAEPRCRHCGQPRAAHEPQPDAWFRGEVDRDLVRAVVAERQQIESRGTTPESLESRLHRMLDEDGGVPGDHPCGHEHLPIDVRIGNLLAERLHLGQQAAENREPIAWAVVCADGRIHRPPTGSPGRAVPSIDLEAPADGEVEAHDLLYRACAPHRVIELVPRI